MLKMKRWKVISYGAIAFLFATVLLFYQQEEKQVQFHVISKLRPIDIQVGFRLSSLQTAHHHTVVFNPFLRKSSRRNPYVFPFIISDVDGRVPFYVNDDVPECSTVNHRHEHYDVEYQSALHMENCVSTPESYSQSKLQKCTHGPMRKTYVESRRLSTFIKQNNIRRIGYLMIDAHGSDFSILKDLIDNTATIIAVRELSVKCQWMNESIPRWFSSNDCGDIVSYMENKFESRLELVEKQTNCRANEYKMTFSQLYRKTHTEKRIVSVDAKPPGVVDIDIGTIGTSVNSTTANKLITFDPFGKLLVQEKYERYPFVISDINGELPFYANDRVGRCSTLNLRNEHYDAAYQTQVHQRCGTIDEFFVANVVMHCMHFPQRTMSVNSVRLSTFVRVRNIRHIGNLKIGAQGSDFSIVKDIVENTDTELNIDSITVECQWLNNSIPLYFTSNDCGDIQDYMAEKFKAFKLSVHLNNCYVNEYTLKYKDLGRKDVSLSL